MVSKYLICLGILISSLIGPMYSAEVYIQDSPPNQEGPVQGTPPNQEDNVQGPGDVVESPIPYEPYGSYGDDIFYWIAPGLPYYYYYGNPYYSNGGHHHGYHEEHGQGSSHGFHGHGSPGHGSPSHGSPGHGFHGGHGFHSGHGFGGFHGGHGFGGFHGFGHGGFHR